MTSRNFKHGIYRLSLLFAVTFAALHLIALPITVTYDGFHYIDLADVLGSSRFPEDWYRTRTPLFPLMLKCAFWLVGRQPLAAAFVSTAMGTAAILLLGSVARRLAGEWTASVVILVLTLNPTIVGYQHAVLTEAGSALFIAIMVASLTRDDFSRRANWRVAFILISSLAAGYYWRQLLLQLAPIAAVIHIIAIWLYSRRARVQLTVRRWTEAGSQGVMIVLVPMMLSYLWDPYTDRSGLRAVSLGQGLLRQALLSPEDETVRPYRQEYEAAISGARYNGNLYSGISDESIDMLSSKLLHGRPINWRTTLFVNSALAQPRRYLAGVARTITLFAGATARNNETRVLRDSILDPNWLGAKIGQGPAKIEAEIKRSFHQETTRSAVLLLLWSLRAVYDAHLMLAMIITAIGLVYGVVSRDVQVAAMTAVPVAYLCYYAMILASIDRFAVPTYPLVFANSVIIPVLMWKRLAPRFQIREWARGRGSAAAPDGCP